MRKVALAVASAALCMGAVATPAKADTCVVEPRTAYQGYAPAYYSYRYNPYMWEGYSTNYSNFTPADCGYYNRRFYGAYLVYPRVRYVVRHYR